MVGSCSRSSNVQEVQGLIKVVQEVQAFKCSNVQGLRGMVGSCSRSSNVQGQGFKKCVDWASFGGYDRAVTL